MKVLLLSPSAYMSPMFSDMIYAPRELALSLADGLVGRGHEVTFATAPDVVTRARLLPGNSATLEFMQKNPDDPLVKRDFEVELLTRAFKEAQDGSYDIVHVYTVTMAHYFDQFSTCPVVYTLHDPLPQKDTLGRVVFEKHAHHRFISISDSQRKSDFALNFLATIYHGIDVAAYPVGPGGNGFVWMGRMVPEKGLEDAIKACVVTNTKLLAASDWQKHAIFDNPLVETVGVVDQDSRARLLGNAKALLFPIKWEEPFGLVMIEAMACGTPVIAYNRGSVPEIVVDGKTGFIVNDIDGMVAAMKKINKIDRAACRKHVEENFSIEKMVQGYEKVYQRALGLSSPT